MRRARRLPLGLVVGVLAAVSAFAFGSSAALAVTPAPHWVIVSTANPAYFKAGDVGDFYEVTAVNDGGAETSGTVTIADVLPAGVTATAISGVQDGPRTEALQMLTCPTSVTCETASGVAAGGYVHVKLTVTVSEHLAGTLNSTATISGGGAQPASASDSTPLSAEPVPFGISLSTSITGEDGSVDTQAGSHPFGFTSIFAFNVASIDTTTLCGQLEPTPGCTRSTADDAKDVNVALPPGLVGDPQAAPRCTQAVFQTYGNQSCPADTQVGGLALYFYGNTTAIQYAPVYDVEPPPGQPGELGFTVGGFYHIPMFFHVRSGGDYGLTAQLDEISEADPVRLGVLRIWGVPAAPSHDSQRLGPECPEGCAGNLVAKPFLTLPTSCTGGELEVPVATDSWQEPGVFPLQQPAGIAGMTGCGALSFTPSLEVQPDTPRADTPAGYTVDLQVPQSEEPEGLVTSELRDATIALPAGVALSPPAANGLQGCSEAQFGTGREGAGDCPAQSSVGEAEVITPLLEKPLRGSVYVAEPKCGGEGQTACTQASATDGELYGLDVEVAGQGVVVKLHGTVSANPATGQLTSTFAENPQLPFGELRLHLNGGERAPLANPQGCGMFTTTSDLTPWSGWAGSDSGPDATPSSSFAIDEGCAGGPGGIPFAPSFSAGTTLPVAGAYSPFTLTFSRHDGEQDLTGLTVSLPPGLLGKIAGIAQCGEAEIRAAEAGAGGGAGGCPENSRVGTVSVAVGAGADPYWQSGSVYLTGPSTAGTPSAGGASPAEGTAAAPFGLAIVVPANAGPFHLGNIVVRAAIHIDPTTAAVTVTSNSLPQIIDGVPSRVQTVEVTIGGQASGAGAGAGTPFTFNPTNCAQQQVTGTIVSAQGAAVGVSSPFAVTGCRGLAFKPVFTASTAGRAGKAGGASLDVRVRSNGGPQAGGGEEANIRSVKVDLPKQLPSRLTTLQKACAAAQFAANPARCPAASNVGTATAVTPLLAHPLSGPAYLVSHGGEAFPNLTIVLQGEGVMLDLVGSTDIKKGITSSTFRTIPDAPIDSFELKLPTGRYSVLGTNLPASAKYDLCGQKLQMPTAIVGQNGAVVKETTKLGVTGCPKSKKASRKKTKHRQVKRKK